jgi:nicotinic acid mononucleotide adenylyltransferase
MSNYIVLDLDILEISSTTVREMIRNKVSVDKVLTPEVKEIIEKENLYI